jgi:O-antigen/teichoic acid export membrane protein
MAGIVPASELGQYVVAVTLASFGMVVVTALNYAVLPTVASGARHAVQPVLRLTLWGIGLVSIALAILAPLVIPLLFGARFAESVPLAQILTLGTPFLAGNAVLTSAFVGDGRPGETAVAETLAAAFTVPALILLLPTYGATAAAMTSVVAYGVSFTFLLYRARRFFGGSFSAFLFPRYADLATIAAVGVTGRRRRRT